jgi:protein-disulfide isomerase
MSKRNSQEAKRAARERLRAEREKQAKKQKVRRQLIVAGAVVGVLAAAGGIAFAITKMNDSSASSSTDWQAVKKQKLVKPADVTGPGGTGVVIGEPGAKKTVDVYEDLRCPACAQYEQGPGPLVLKGVKNGKYKVKMHLGDLIDGNLGGSGSKNAISALGASLNVSKDAFLDYHAKLYSPQFHPEEQGPDKFADDSYLLKVADTVPALKDDDDFKKAVKEGTYDKWALNMVADFKKGKVEGTPTIRIEGEDVQQQQLPGELKKLGVKLSAPTG